MQHTTYIVEPEPRTVEHYRPNGTLAATTVVLDYVIYRVTDDEWPCYVYRDRAEAEAKCRELNEVRAAIEHDAANSE